MQDPQGGTYAGDGGRLSMPPAGPAADSRKDLAGGRPQQDNLSSKDGLDTVAPCDTSCNGARTQPAVGSTAASQLHPMAMGPPQRSSSSAAPSAPSTPPTPAAAHPLPATQPTLNRPAPITLQHLSPDALPQTPSSRSHAPATSLPAPDSSPAPSLPDPVAPSGPLALPSDASAHLIDAAVAKIAGISGAENYQNFMIADPGGQPQGLQLPQGLDSAANGSPRGTPGSMQPQASSEDASGLPLGPNSGGQQESDAVQICFDFTKGACTRGSLCRYSHDVATIVQFNSREKGVCFDYLRNQCQRGLLCRFSHDVSNMAQQQQPTFTAGAKNRSTAICYDFVKGACVRGENCTFSHDLAMIARKAPRARAARANEVCYDFLRGRCVRGMNCRFSHQVAYDPVTGFPINPMVPSPMMPMQPQPNGMGYGYPMQGSQFNSPMTPPASQQPLSPSMMSQQPLSPSMVSQQASQAPHLSPLQALSLPQQPSAGMLAPGEVSPQLQPGPGLGPSPQHNFLPAAPPAGPRHSTSAINFQPPLMDSPKADLQPLSPSMTPTATSTPTHLAQMLSHQSPLPIASSVDPASPTNPASLQNAMAAISLRSSAPAGTLAPAGGFASPTYPTAQRGHPFSTSNIPTTHNPTRLMHQTGPNDLPRAAGAYPSAADPAPAALRPLRTSHTGFPGGHCYTPTPTAGSANPLLDSGFGSGAATPSSPHLTPASPHHLNHALGSVAASISSAQSILLAMHRQQQHQHQAGHPSYTASLGASLGNTPEFSNPMLGTSLQPTQSGSSNPPLEATPSAAFPPPNGPPLEAQLSSQSWGAPEHPAGQNGEVGWNPLEQARTMWSTTQLGVASPR